MLSSLFSYVGYFASSLGLLAGGLALYVRITPCHEISLIRAGNAAAAWSLGGAALGLALPIAMAVIRTESFMAMMFWAASALVTNLLVFLVMGWILPGFRSAIEADSAAHGITLGGISVATGVLNAAALS